MDFGREKLTDIGSVLVVEKTPKDRHEGVEDRDTAIERQLGNLSGREFAVGIPKFHHRLVLVGSEHVGHNAVVTRLLYGIVDRTSILQVNGFGRDQGVGLFAGVGRNDEFANIGRVAETLLDEVVVADTEPLGKDVSLV
jgi:hypothetical protein